MVNQTQCCNPKEPEWISPRASLSRLTKEHHRDHSLFLVESRGLCGAVLPFVEERFPVQGCWMLSVTLTCERLDESEKRWGLRTDLRRRRSRRVRSGLLEWEPHTKILLISQSWVFFQMTSVALKCWRRKISSLSIPKSICNAAQQLLVDLFSYPSSGLMLFTQSFSVINSFIKEMHRKYCLKR